MQQRFFIHGLLAVSLLAGCQATPLAVGAPATAAQGDRTLSLRIEVPAARRVLESFRALSPHTITRYVVRLTIEGPDGYSDVADSDAGADGTVTFEHLRAARYRVHVAGLDRDGQTITKPAWFDHDLTTGSVPLSAPRTVTLEMADLSFDGILPLPNATGTVTVLQPWVETVSVTYSRDGLEPITLTYDPTRTVRLEHLRANTAYDFTLTATGGGRTVSQTRTDVTVFSGTSFQSPAQPLVFDMSPTYAGHHPMATAADGTGGLWIADEAGGTVTMRRRLNDGTLAANPPSFSGRLSTVLAPDGHGGVWVGTHGPLAHAVYHVSSSNVLTALGAPGFTAGSLTGFVADGQGGAWLVTEIGRVAHYAAVASGAAPDRLFDHAVFGFSDSDTISIVGDGQGGVWGPTATGLVHIPAGGDPLSVPLGGFGHHLGLHPAGGADAVWSHHVFNGSHRLVKVTGTTVGSPVTVPNGTYGFATVSDGQDGLFVNPSAYTLVYRVSPEGSASQFASLARGSYGLFITSDEQGGFWYTNRANLYDSQGNPRTDAMHVRADGSETRGGTIGQIALNSGSVRDFQRALVPSGDNLWSTYYHDTAPRVVTAAFGAVGSGGDPAVAPLP